MTSQTPALRKDALPKITFNGLAGPKRSWSCGQERLISDAGSYLERLTSLCGPPDAIAELVKIIVDATERSVDALVSGGENMPNIGIGWWQGEQWDLLIYMEVSGSGTPAVALADVLNANLDLLEGVYVLRGVDHPMWGCSDTFWALAEIGHTHPEKRDAAFDLALRLCTNGAMRGEELEEGEEDGPQAPNPSDVLEFSKDVYAFINSLAVWDNARKLEHTTVENTLESGEPRRL